MRFGWKETGFMFEHELEADNLPAAKAKIRALLGLRKLPAGLQVWDSANRKVVRWRPVPFAVVAALPLFQVG